MSPRTTVRAARRALVGQLLATGIPALGGRVYDARVWPLKLPELPAALVFGWQETKTRKSLDVWTHQFEVLCSMAVELRVQAADGPSLESNMETLAGAVEAVVLTSPQLLGLTGVLERIDRVETKLEASAASESLQGTVTMSFDFIWTEIHQAAVPSDEPTFDFAIATYPLPK